MKDIMKNNEPQEAPKKKGGVVIAKKLNIVREQFDRFGNIVRREEKKQ